MNRTCLLLGLCSLLFCSCGKNENADLPECIKDAYDLSNPLKQRILADMEEQFFRACCIAHDGDYHNYQYLRKPAVHTSGENPISKSDITQLSFYDIIGDAYVLAYAFSWTPGQGSWFTWYGNYLNEEEQNYVFPLSTYPSVWTDGTFYPTIMEAIEAGVIPETVATVDYWKTLVTCYDRVNGSHL